MNSIFDLPIFCINLSKNTDRKSFMQLQTKQKKITYIDAIYGDDIEKKQLNHLKTNSIKSGHNSNPLYSGEIGCLLSHLKTFVEALKSTQSEYVMIMEDDINLITHYNHQTDQYILDHLHEYECIQLCIILGNHVFKTFPDTRKDHHFVDWSEYRKKYSPYGCFWSTGCYIISRNAMSKILNKYILQEKLYPSDYYIYETVHTGTLLPPLIYPAQFNSTIMDNKHYHSLSYDFLSGLYHPTKLILISLWFGKLPDYFQLWMHSIQGKDYDVLFITDQTIANYPSNLKILQMNLEDINTLISKKMKCSITLKNVNKLVDLKPMFGELFYDLINGYTYWGWTDIDILMGDVLSFIKPFPEVEVFSFGYQTFGPMMIFKNPMRDLYTHISNYHEILNDDVLCKVDEPWFFTRSGYTEDRKIYTDQKTPVRYYNYNRLLEYVCSKKLHVFHWNTICWDIEWEIVDKPNTLKNKTYTLDQKLFINDREICFCHLTQLKQNPVFLKEIQYPFTENEYLTIQLNYTCESYKKEDTKDMNIYEFYQRYVKTTCSVKRIETETSTGK